MRSLAQTELRVTEELYRIISTMLKKLKTGKKSEKIVQAEAVSDILFLMQIVKYKPQKFSVLVGEDREEVAKIVFYPVEDSVVIHDLYVAPKVRKQTLAKSLVSEVLLISGNFPKIAFYTRETNKPVANLVNFFAGKFEIDQSKIKKSIVPVYYVDGGNAVVYEIPNPVYAMRQKEAADNANDSPTGGLRGPQVREPLESGPKVGGTKHSELEVSSDPRREEVEVVSEGTDNDSSRAV